jgi:hypothetical protein
MGEIIDETVAAKQKKDKRPGKPVKLSAFVVEHLRRLGPKAASYDQILRTHLGLPGRKGDKQALRSYWLLPGDPPVVRPHTAKGQAECRGEAILQATRKGLEKAVRVILVREVP